jgi:hypothetical protein
MRFDLVKIALFVIALLVIYAVYNFMENSPFTS